MVAFSAELGRIKQSLARRRSERLTAFSTEIQIAFLPGSLFFSGAQFFVYAFKIQREKRSMETFFCAYVVFSQEKRETLPFHLDSGKTNKKFARHVNEFARRRCFNLILAVFSRFLH